MNIVIGSGPAGIACAHALLEKGKEVLVVDAGFELEQKQKDLLGKVRSSEDNDALYELRELENSQKITGKGLMNKLVYGSDFPYRGAEENLDLVSFGTGLVPSLATGGLSNVWGSAMLPYRQSDIQDWPITESDLAAHYRKVVEITGLSAKKDDLEELFPIYTDRPSYLRPSSQASRLFASMERIRSNLKADGIYYGSSRVTVGPSLNHDQECVYCAQCIYGCPYACIYNSGDDLRRLLRAHESRLCHQTNVIVTAIEETDAGVKVSGFDRVTKETIQLEGERAFLAAGVIPTARIMLKSLGAYDTPLEMKDSQYFLFPMLSLKGNKDAVQEATYTVSQMFIELQDKEISPYTVHLQVYTYNDIITKTLEQKFWFLPGLRQALVRQLEHRTLIVQGFLHSQHSGKMRLRLTHDPVTMKESFSIEGESEPGAQKVIAKVLAKLGKHFRGLGIFPVPQALEFCLPGRGFHSGGSLPMKAKPGPMEADIYGRVGGASRIHVVDASVLPTIPATTITLTAMANAHRIGSVDY